MRQIPARGLRHPLPYAFWRALRHLVRRVCADFQPCGEGGNALRIDSVCGSCIRYCAESRMLQGAGFGDEMRQRSAEGACCIRALLAFAMGITSSCAAVSALFFSRAARGRNALRELHTIPRYVQNAARGSFSGYERCGVLVRWLAASVRRYRLGWASRHLALRQCPRCFSAVRLGA